ncbi:MAG: hypothetical protein IPO08_21955 [Xanthomonadales bacterium]|nr:hypothetical protein [Xanthomonadales bacterium]
MPPAKQTVQVYRVFDRAVAKQIYLSLGEERSLRKVQDVFQERYQKRPHMETLQQVCDTERWPILAADVDARAQQEMVPSLAQELAKEYMQTSKLAGVAMTTSLEAANHVIASAAKGISKAMQSLDTSEEGMTLDQIDGMINVAGKLVSIATRAQAIRRNTPNSPEADPDNGPGSNMVELPQATLESLLSRVQSHLERKKRSKLIDVTPNKEQA